MSGGKRIHLSAFDMACMGHQSPGLWRHPLDQSHRYKDLEYWTDLARTLERGCFDNLLIADVPGVEAGVDGFNLAYAITPGTFEDVVDHLVPELQRRELLRTKYEGSTLRESFCGEGQTLLGDDHPGSWFRRPASLQAASWRG